MEIKKVDQLPRDHKLCEPSVLCGWESRSDGNVGGGVWNARVRADNVSTVTKLEADVATFSYSRPASRGPAMSSTSMCHNQTSLQNRSHSD